MIYLNYSNYTISVTGSLRFFYWICSTACGKMEQYLAQQYYYDGVIQLLTLFFIDSVVVILQLMKAIVHGISMWSFTSREVQKSSSLKRAQSTNVNDNDLFGKDKYKDEMIDEVAFVWSTKEITKTQWNHNLCVQFSVFRYSVIWCGYSWFHNFLF